MRLVFHIGLHKTGSTFLQGVLHRNAPELHGRGIHYAPAGGHAAHHDIAWAMLRGDFRPLTTAITDPRIGACETVVLSSEDFESLLILPQLAQEAEEWAQTVGFDRIEWHASLRRQDEYFWSLYSEMSKHVFVDPLAIFHEVMQRGYLYLEGATGARAGSPFWHFCFNWSLVEEFASLVRGEIVLYRFADEVPLPGRGFIASLTGGSWSLPSGPAPEQEVNARLSDPEVHQNYVLRFVDSLEESGRDRLAAIIRQRACVDPQLKTLINEQLQARYIAGNQAVFERLARRRSALRLTAKKRRPKGRILRVAANLVARAGGSSGDVSVAAAGAGVWVDPPRRHPGRDAPDLDRDPRPFSRATKGVYRLARDAAPPRGRPFDADADGSRPPPPNAGRFLVSTLTPMVAALGHVKPRSRRILARRLDTLGRLISQFGRLISHFGGEMQVHGAWAALRSTSLLVKSHLQWRWISARKRRAVTLAYARQWVGPRPPLPSRAAFCSLDAREACEAGGDMKAPLRSA
jgi:hypothetical protein